MAGQQPVAQPCQLTMLKGCNIPTAGPATIATPPQATLPVADTVPPLLDVQPMAAGATEQQEKKQECTEVACEGNTKSLEEFEKEAFQKLEKNLSSKGQLLPLKQQQRKP